MLFSVVLTGMCLMYFLFFIMYYWFFFFKQKTAYEVRISDWSSDVCSSDLKGVAGADAIDDARDVDFVGLVTAITQVDARRDAMMVGGDRVARGRGDQLEPREGGEARLGRFAAPVRALAAAFEIGRAHV